MAHKISAAAGKNIHIGYNNPSENPMLGSPELPQKAQAEAMLKSLNLGQKIYYILNGKTQRCVLGFYTSARNSYAIFDDNNKQLFNRHSDELIEDFCQGYIAIAVKNKDFVQVMEKVCHKLMASKLND